MADVDWEFADSELHAAILRECSTDAETLARIRNALWSSLGTVGEVEEAEEARDCPGAAEGRDR